MSEATAILNLRTSSSPRMVATDKGLFPTPAGELCDASSELEIHVVPPLFEFSDPTLELVHRVRHPELGLHEARLPFSGCELWEMTFSGSPVHARDPEAYLRKFVRAGIDNLQMITVSPKLEISEDCGRRMHRAWALRWEPTRPDLYFLPEEFIPVVFFQKNFNYFYQLFAHLLPSGSVHQLSMVFTDIRGVIEVPGHDASFFQGPLVMTFFPSEILWRFRGPYLPVGPEAEDGGVV